MYFAFSGSLGCWGVDLYISRRLAVGSKAGHFPLSAINPPDQIHISSQGFYLFSTFRLQIWTPDRIHKVESDSSQRTQVWLTQMSTQKYATPACTRSRPRLCISQHSNLYPSPPPSPLSIYPHPSPPTRLLRAYLTNPRRSRLAPSSSDTPAPMDQAHTIQDLS